MQSALTEKFAKSPVTLKEAAAEALGTSVLVFTVGCNVLAGSPSWGALSIACLLAVMVYTLAPISGAHLNPAVSVALGLAGKEPWPKVGAYACIQTFSGALAGWFYALMFHDSFTLRPTAGHYLWQAGMAEFLYTATLAFVVLNVAASKMHGGSNEFYGLAIGGVIVAGAYSGGSISMGCFNPAVGVAIDVSSGGILHGVCYTVFQLLGAVMAAAVFRFCRPDDYETMPHTFDGLPDYDLVTKLGAEFTGTTVLVLTAGLVVAEGTKAGTVSIAAALVCMIFALSSVSGGHFNPAVTLAVHSAGREDAPTMKDTAMYFGIQVAAGMFGSLLALAMTGGVAFPMGPVYPFRWLQAMLCEFLFSALLAVVVLCTTSPKAATSLTQFGPLAIGASVICGGLATSHVSGGVMNPAVAAGYAFSWGISGGGLQAVVAFFAYALPQLLGGELAAAAFRYTRPEEYKDKLDASGASYYGSSSA